MANREHKPYPKHKRVRSTHREPEYAGWLASLGHVYSRPRYPKRSSTKAESDVRRTDLYRRTEPKYAKMARRCVVGLYTMSAIWGALQIAFPENGILYLDSAILFAGFATGWAILDAKARGISILPLLQMLYSFLWPIGAVIYLVYRSGMRGLVTSIFHAIGLVATLAGTFYTTFYALHFAGLLDPRYYQ